MLKIMARLMEANGKIWSRVAPLGPVDLKSVDKVWLSQLTLKIFDDLGICASCRSAGGRWTTQFKNRFVNTNMPQILGVKLNTWMTGVPWMKNGIFVETLNGLLFAHRLQGMSTPESHSAPTGKKDIIVTCWYNVYNVDANLNRFHACW